MINPLEVLFVKVKSYQLESDWITSKMARTYEKWHRGKVKCIDLSIFIASHAHCLLSDDVLVDDEETLNILKSVPISKRKNS